MQPSRSRAWVFTINNYECCVEWVHENMVYRTTSVPALFELVGLWTPQPLYLVCETEIAPETGTPHVQGYVVFENALSLKSVSCLPGMSSAHLDAARGNPIENRTYCSKAFTAYSSGELPPGMLIRHYDDPCFRCEVNPDRCFLRARRAVMMIDPMTPKIPLIHCLLVEHSGVFGTHSADLP